MNFERLIRNWHSQVIEQPDYFAKFVFEYLAFIAYLKRIKHFQGDDRSTIEQLKQDSNTQRQYSKVIERDPELQQTWHTVISELSRCPIKNVSRPNQLSLHWRGNVAGVINSVDDWSNIIEFWYTIRNNLFHGDKDPESERDMLMAQYGYSTLAPLIAVFVNKLDLERQ